MVLVNGDEKRNFDAPAVSPSRSACWSSSFPFFKFSAFFFLFADRRATPAENGHTLAGHHLWYLLPSATITYKSEAADPKGNLTFWLGHLGGVGGFFDLEDNVLPSTTPTKLQVDFFDETGDGEQWAVSAGLSADGVDGMFAFSDPVVIAPASSSSSSASASATSASNLGVSSTSPATSSTSPTNTSAPANVSPSPSASLASSTTKSSPSVGLIVGVTFGATAVLIILLLFAFLYFRKVRRRRHMGLEPRPPIEPAFVSQSAFATSHAGTSFGSDSLAPKIEPFMPTPTVSVSRTPSDSAPTTLSSKAAQVRQEYLMNQMRAVQWQLQALQGAGGPTSPTNTSEGSASVPGSELDSVGLAQARLQNEALQQRIQALEEQLQSHWALGLSDEPPPGYLE
ncbi:F-box domain-containing protein [Mycena venus]|uniref:F-box domain-containing protein n=1 Tax=Mycena venus TaxID=2733690 RepID=A0A8H6X7A9_9AGAR|nr:F-box domain-containing protein [Mycena venus]